MKKALTILILCFVYSGFSQTRLKGNLFTALIGIPNIGLETKIANKFTLQVDLTASFWESYKGGPQKFFMIFPEVRYYTNSTNKGFFIGGHIGGSKFELQKLQYINTDYYQKGYNIMYGATIGYLFEWNKNFNIELFLGGGSQQAFYKGYLLSTGERYESAKNFNKSGEFIPYRGGVMLVYKLN